MVAMNYGCINEPTHTDYTKICSPFTSHFLTHVIMSHPPTQTHTNTHSGTVRSESVFLSRVHLSEHLDQLLLRVLIDCPVSRNRELICSTDTQTSPLPPPPSHTSHLTSSTEDLHLPLHPFCRPFPLPPSFIRAEQPPQTYPINSNPPKQKSPTPPHPPPFTYMLSQCGVVELRRCFKKTHTPPPPPPCRLQQKLKG